MSDEKKEPWLNYLAITTVILAVFATLATYNGGKYSTRSVVDQNQASDQWSYYQAKSIKGYLYEVQADKLELDLKVMPEDLAARAQDDFGKKIDSYRSKIRKYEDEKKEIQEKARLLETDRDDCKIHSKFFGYAIIFLQIALLLCAIAGFTRQKYLWYASIFLGVIGIYCFVQGFYAMPLSIPGMPK